MTSKGVRLNIGCGGRPLSGYINVDMDDLEKLRERYVGRFFPESLEICNWDIFNLPVEDESVDEVLCEAMIEHLSFSEEPLFFGSSPKLVEMREEMDSLT